MSTQKGASSSKKAPNTLSSIVSNLVRSAIGGGDKHNHVADEDLDKYVADMIMMNAAESRAKYEKYGLTGSKTAGSLNPTDVGSSSSNDKIKLASGVVIDRADSNGLKTNKRFLSSIIKHTDSHNQALIRSEEKRATEAAKELIADLDRKAAERGRQSGGRRPNTERMYREEDWRHSDRSSASSKSSKISLSSRSKALSSSQSGRMRMDEIGENQSLFGRGGGDSDTWKKTPLSPDSRSESGSDPGSSSSSQPDPIARSRSSRSRPRSRSPEGRVSKSKSRDQHSSRGLDKSKDDSSLKKTELEPSSSSGSILGSRMDKYFQEGYDPLLDVHGEDEGNKNSSRTSKSSKKSKKRKSSRKEEKSKRSSDDRSRHKSKRQHRHRSESPGSDDDEEDERKESKRRRYKSRRGSDTDSEDEREGDKNRKTSSSRSSRSHRKSHGRDSDTDTDIKEEGDRKESSSRSKRSSHKRKRVDSDTEDENEDRKASSKRRQRTSRLESGSESDEERKGSSSSRSKRRRH